MRSRRAPANIWTSRKPTATPSARSWASPTTWSKIAGVTHGHAGHFWRERHRTLEDLAGAETDDLVGWTERKKEKDAEPVRHKGVLEGFDIGRKEAEDMIMSARVLAGWIKAEDLLPPPEADAEAAEGEDGGEGDGGKDATAQG